VLFFEGSRVRALPIYIFSIPSFIFFLLSHGTPSAAGVQLA
jgi:hypothetical protein